MHSHPERAVESGFFKGFLISGWGPPHPASFMKIHKKNYPISDAKKKLMAVSTQRAELVVWASLVFVLIYMSIVKGN